MSHAVWSAMTPYLCTTRRVIAFDIAGFGLTPPLSNGTDPTVGRLVDGLAQSLHDVGVEIPVDIAGNSLGGTIALEAATRGIARSVVAIAPAGLWKEHPPHHVKYVFRGMRIMATNFPRLVKAALQVAWLREILFTVPISPGCARIPAREACRAIDDLAGSPGFEATFDHSRSPLSARHITVPVTVAFGDRDWILPKRSRCRDGLPPHATWIEKPTWGHVPMLVDPAGVARLILQATGAGAVALARYTCYNATS